MKDDPMGVWRDKITAGREASPKLGHKVEMVCDGCGNTFWEYPSRRPKPMKFCTRQCGLDYQQGKFTQEADTEPKLPIDRTAGMTIVLHEGKLKQI